MIYKHKTARYLSKTSSNSNMIENNSVEQFAKEVISRCAKFAGMHKESVLSIDYKDLIHDFLCNLKVEEEDNASFHIKNLQNTIAELKPVESQQPEPQQNEERVIAKILSDLRRSGQHTYSTECADLAMIKFAEWKTSTLQQQLSAKEKELQEVREALRWLWSHAPDVESIDNSSDNDFTLAIKNADAIVRRYPNKVTEVNP